MLNCLPARLRCVHLKTQAPPQATAPNARSYWTVLFLFFLVSACQRAPYQHIAQDARLGSWPMPRHDAHLTGHTDVPGRITTPRVIGQYPLGAAKCIRLWAEDLDEDGAQDLLAPAAGGLLAVTDKGEHLWHVQTNETPIVTIADLDDDGEKEIVLRGPEVRAAEDGRLLWRPEEARARHEYRIHVGRFIPEYQGQQIAAVTMRGYDVSAHVYTFEQGAAKGTVLWERTFQTSDFGDYAEGMISDIDRDGDLELCVAIQGGFVALDLRTGEEKLRFEWEADGVKQRNYGQIAARDVDGDGRSEVILVNTLVALQVAVVKIDDGGRASLMWNHYWGHWYPNSPYLLHTALYSIADLDGDGRLEIALSLYEHGKGWTLQVYDARDGTVLAQKQGLYLESVMLRKSDGQALLLCSEQRNAEPARFSALRGLVYEDGALRELWHREDAHLEGQWADRHEVDFGSGGAQAMGQRATVLGDWNRDGLLEFVISEDRDKDSRTDRLAAIDPSRDGDWHESVAWSVDPEDDVSVLHVLDAMDDSPRLLVADGRGHIRALDRMGAEKGQFFAGGPFIPAPAVADLDGDGTNEIAVASSDGHINALKFNDFNKMPWHTFWRRAGWGTFGLYSGSGDGMPVAVDLDEDGRNEVLIGVYDRNMGAGLACLQGDGSLRWRWFWPSEVSGPEYRSIRSWVAGRFSGQGEFDVFLSTRKNAQTNTGRMQESWVLDGATGRVRWHRVAEDIPDYWLHTLGPSNLPSVGDVDGNGIDDILMMGEALVVLLDGRNGNALGKPISPMTHFGEGTPWTADASIAFQDLNSDGNAELLLTASFGAWGAMALDGKPLWSIDPGVSAECQLHGGVGDVDGDGALELGMPHAEGFRCYDAATGRLRWKMPNLKGTTDVVTADIDGDGRDEFIFGSGSALIALKGAKEDGTILWSLDLEARVGAPIIADVNKDGFGEILVGTDDGMLNVISGP